MHGEPISDREISQKIEDDHLRLQRQVRLIQNEREARSMGVHPQFRRKDRLMRKLKRDYLNYVKDLQVARSGSHKKKDMKMKAGLERALLYRVQTEQETEEGLFLMEQLEQLLQRQKKQMIELRKLVTVSIGQLAERRHLSERRLMSTENKLETATTRFNLVQWDNRRIRDEIEHMMKDRALFNQAWSKMLGMLNKGKKFLNDLFESSTLAYDQRDEWCTKLRSVQEKGKMDQMIQVQVRNIAKPNLRRFMEMRDLQKHFDHEMKLYNFLAKKGIIRINQKQEEREEAAKIKQEEDNRREIVSHRKILDEIFGYTDEANVGRIIDIFKRIEANNFSLYKLMTDYCAQNEVLRRDVARLRRDIADRREWNEMMEERRLSKISRMKEELQQQRDRTEEKKAQVAAATNKLRDTMEKVEEIFKMLNCSLEPIQNILGDKGPSLNHLDLTFCLIADKIKEYIELTYYHERSTQKRGDVKSSRLKNYVIHSDYPKTLSVASINALVPASPCPSCIEARWFLRVTEKPEEPFDKGSAIKALSHLTEDPAFVRSDRVHPLTECRAPRSRNILAKRYM